MALESACGPTNPRTSSIKSCTAFRGSAQRGHSTRMCCKVSQEVLWDFHPLKNPFSMDPVVCPKHSTDWKSGWRTALPLIGVGSRGLHSTNQSN